MSIPFTRYHLPNGRRSRTSIDRPHTVERWAEAVTDAGWRFEVEVLTTGEVSLTVHDPDTEEDVAIEVVPNGEGVGAAVDRLVSSAYAMIREREADNG